MADVLTPDQRSFNMSRIRSCNTRPEMIVRSLAHSLGYRFRLHQRNLAGKPDLVFPRHRKIIFVHGCFFHMHDCKYGSVVPKTREEFWHNKRSSNVERDKKNLAALRASGWSVLCVWECMTKPGKIEDLAKLIAEFLESKVDN